MRLLRWLLAAASLALLVAAGWATVRFYWAERLVETLTVENLERAVELAPSSSNAWTRLGALRERRGDAEGARAALQRAMALNAYNAPAWINLGLHWELAGDPVQAERCLREAVRVDTTYYPRWALANFYLRQQDTPRFWESIRRAITSKPDDLTPCFELCWRAFDDAGQILQNAIPDEPRINRLYQDFLMATGRLVHVAEVWKRIEPRLETEDRRPALEYTDQLLADRRVDQALRVWNRLCEAGLLPFQPLDPAQGRLITNGQFQLGGAGRGFDWGLSAPDGISGAIEAFRGANSFRIQFSGTHPEITPLLFQRVPVEPLRSYRLSFRYATEQLPADTGLHWMVEDVLGGSILANGRSLAAAEEQWADQQTSFTTGPRTHLVRLQLTYRRAPGTTRAQGSVAVRDVELAALRAPLPSAGKVVAP